MIPRKPIGFKTTYHACTIYSRWLGYGKHWQLQPKKKKRRRNANTSKSENNPSHVGATDEDGSKVPPSFLLPTASPYVFVSKPAAHQTGIDPGELFRDVISRNSVIPPTFQTSRFHYFASSKFNHDLPDQDQAEVAFLGRSNVGKSSLINALMRNKLARISKQPGRTQQAHFFGLVRNDLFNDGTYGQHRDKQKIPTSDATGFLVDLPGYGYAVGPDHIVDRWQRNTQTFLLKRRDAGSLKRLYLLLDSRHGSATPLDQSVMSWLDEAEIPYTLVWTKIDQGTGPAQVIKCVNEACIRYVSHQQNTNEETTSTEQSPVVHVTSSKLGQGIPELLSSIEVEFFTG